MAPSRTSRSFEPRFLVVSLGNPPPDHESHHSAGHILLTAAQQLLQRTQPDFRPLRLGKKGTSVSLGEKYIFVKSPTKMNDTGRWLAKAYAEILEMEELQPSELGVVVIHDEMEQTFGAVNTVGWTSNPKGHNGVKSVRDSLRRTTDEAPWLRISVGIGRPADRDVRTVSAYVLKSFSPRQRGMLDAKAEEVLDKLEELEREWARRVAGTGHRCVAALSETV